MAQRKRRPPVNRGISLEAVRAFARARELEAQGARPSGTGQSEYDECRRILRRTLDRPPWKAHPLDVKPEDLDDPEPSPDFDLQGALELRRLLEEAAAP
jgi:hypothetical protein